MPVEELGMSFSDPSLLRGATAQLLIKNRSEIFSSNILSPKDVASLHDTTAIVTFLDDFFSHSWSTSRFDKWAALLLYLNAQAAAVALVTSALLWSLLENLGIIPRLLYYSMEDDEQGGTSGMPMLVGLISGFLFVFEWQRIRALLGLRSRMCFLDKVCIDQMDETRKSAGIASLGAFLGASDNFVVLFSPEYFSRLWCCYELAAFRHLQVEGKQKITFLPAAFPRVLFANAVSMSVWSLPHALMPIIGPWLGIDPENVSDDDYTKVTYPWIPFSMWCMYECQKYAASREKIEDQMENFSIERADCFDEKDRPRVEHEIAKWFGNGDRAEGIRKFDAFVRNDIRNVIEEITGKRKFLSAGLPWVFILLSSTSAILEDVGGIASLYTLNSWETQLQNFMSCSSCILVGTPMIPVAYLWCSSKTFRFWGGWPMVFASPFVCTFIPYYVLIVGSLSTDLTFNCVQYCLVLALGAFVFRDSLSQMGEALGLNQRSTTSHQKQKAFAIVPSQEN